MQQYSERTMRRQWLIAFGSALGLVFSVGPIIQFSFGMFIGPVGEALHADRAAISAALLIALTLSGLMTPVLGLLVDRFGVRRIALPGVGLFAVSVALTGIASVSLRGFLICYAVAGIFSAAQTPLVYGKAITSAFDSRRGLALGIAMAGVGLGTVIVPRFAQSLISIVGWREAYIVLGATTLVTVIPAIALFLPAGPGNSQAAALHPANDWPRRATPLRSALFWKFAGAFMATAAAASGVTAHIVPMMTDRHVPAHLAGMAIIAAGVSLIAGRIVAGFLLDRFFAPYIAIVFISMPLAGILILLSTSSVLCAVLAAVLVGMGLGAEVDLIAYLQSRYIGMQRFGETYGYFLAIFMAGSGVGPFVMGLSYTRTGSYALALAVLAAGLTVACITMLTVGQYRFAIKTAGATLTHS